MERALKWLLLILIVAEIALVRFGVLHLSTAVSVVIGVEVLLLAVASRQIIVAVRRYRRDRAGGLDVWAAAEEGLAVLLPRPLARFAAMEPRLWACLGTWLLRRHRTGPADFPYHKRSLMGSLLVLVAFSTPVELLLFELLIPWDWLRWLLLIAAVYALVWAFAVYASLVVLPHRLESGGLLLRYGTLAEGRIPYGAIESVELSRQQKPGAGDGLRVDAEAKTAYLSVGGRTDITLRLREPLSLQGAFSRTPPVSIVHVAADQPEPFAERLAAILVTATPSTGPQT